MTHYAIRVARHAGIVALFVLAAVLGATSGVLFAYAKGLPEVRALAHYTPGTVTRLYARDGQVIGEFATQHRDIVGYDDISPLFRQAIVAAEDADFYQHFGLSISRIIVTAVKDLIKHRKEAGASTLTQQLARNLFLTPQKTWTRKIKEAILAVELEKRFTKQEILTLYCNQMYFGRGAYGVEAASRMYFGKHARNLTLDEAAMLAGIVQLPERENPYADMKWALVRRNYALQRMADVGYITEARAQAAERKPIVLRRPPPPDTLAPYFVEDVREYLQRTYGTKELYRGGLSVYTTLDAQLQAAADKAIQHGVRVIDKLHGWRRPTTNVLRGGHTIAGYRNDRWQEAMQPGDIVPAVVVALTGPGRRDATVRVGGYDARLTPADFRWTHRAAARELFKPGDLIEVDIRKMNRAAQTMTVRLDQQPKVQGALLAIDNHTGQILAMVGGDSFARSKFNRALQAYRQLGSTFKPIIYTAAIDRGYTAVSIIDDTQASFPQGPGLPEYQPHDYDHEFEGPITLRRALEDSRNVPAVRMLNQLTPAVVYRYARRFGFKENFPPYLSVALGASEATLMNLTSAYTVFPNQGVRMKPYDILKVENRDGSILEQNRPQPEDVIRADTAFVMTSLLRGVVQRGTAQAASSINWPLAGKTGTVDNNTDAWFIGFDPNITVGVWVGYDEKKSLGANEQGAVAALPIWMDVMKAWIAAQPDRDDPPQFQAPSDIVFMTVNEKTGVPEPAGTPGSITESFIAGTQPGATNVLASTASLQQAQPH